MRFIGRKEYLEDLESLWRKKTSSIIACRGRRRIGKSTLFREFARRTADVYVEIEGLPPDRNMTNRMQLDNFVSALASQTGCRQDAVSDWLHAFQRLEQQIDDTKRMVVLLDEISWMGGYDPAFPGVLRTAWETFLHRHDRLILVVCGSVSAWIKENILGNTGFTGRFSRDYVLPELSLAECAEFWGETKERLSSREIVDVLSVTGGVPRYLEEIDTGLDADENVRSMCFMSAGELYNDFDAIFDPMFGIDIELKRRILLELVGGPLSAAELERTFGLDRNGRVSKSLKALKEGGFVADDPRLNPETGEQARTARFRLRDNYTRFYLKYIAPRKMQIEMGSYRFASLAALPDWNAVMGLQFENLIINNAMSLLPFLHVGNVVIESAAPYRNTRRGTDAGSGCQIDLLIQTPRTAYVVEIKRRKEIGTEVIDEVERKIKRLPLRKGMTPRPVLVYEGELHPAVEASGFFDAVVPVRKLLGI
jgi:AAA+ ATPase superfamily predicted ATPase